MTRYQWLVVIGFALALAAGAVLGVAQDRARKPAERGSWLAAQLDLTPTQQEEMRRIWEEALPASGREHRERREAVHRERDDRVRAMLTDEQVPAYEAILADHAARLAGLDEERSRAVQEAVEKTKAILNPAQRARYEEMLADKDGRPPHPGRGLVRPPAASGGSDAGGNR